MSANPSEEQYAAARAKAGQQDRKVPFLIHRVNGRLLPNVAKLRSHPDLMPYNGSVKASLEERMRFVRTGSSRRVTNSVPEQELPPFDVAKATVDELIAFAQDEYGKALNPKAPAHILRNQILKLASADAPPGADDTDLG